MLLYVARHTFSVAEAAEALGVTPPTVYRAIGRGDLPHLRIGRRIVVPKIALLRLLGETPVTDMPTTEETQR